MPTGAWAQALKTVEAAPATVAENSWIGFAEFLRMVLLLNLFSGAAATADRANHSAFFQHLEGDAPSCAALWKAVRLRMKNLEQAVLCRVR